MEAAIAGQVNLFVNKALSTCPGMKKIGKLVYRKMCYIYAHPKPLSSALIEIA